MADRISVYDYRWTVSVYVIGKVREHFEQRTRFQRVEGRRVRLGLAFANCVSCRKIAWEGQLCSAK